MKVGKIQSSQNFGRADGPRVRGGRSAVHEICHQMLCRKMFQPKNIPRTVRPMHRLASDTPVRCSLSKARTVRQGSADSLPLLRKFYQRPFLWEAKSEIIMADSPPGDRGRPAPAQNGGIGHLWIYMPKSLSPPTKPHRHHQKLSLSFSLKHVGETSRSRVFGMILGRSEHILGLFLQLSFMSSRYFIDSSPYILGFYHKRG